MQRITIGAWRDGLLYGETTSSASSAVLKLGSKSITSIHVAVEGMGRDAIIIKPTWKRCVNIIIKRSQTGNDRSGVNFSVLSKSANPFRLLTKHTQGHITLRTKETSNIACSMAVVYEDAGSSKTDLTNGTGVILFVKHFTVTFRRQPVIQSEIPRLYSTFFGAIDSVAPCHPYRATKKTRHRFLGATTTVAVVTSFITVSLVRLVEQYSTLKTSACWLWRITGEFTCSTEPTVVHFANTSTATSSIFSAFINRASGIHKHIIAVLETLCHDCHVRVTQLQRQEFLYLDNATFPSVH